MSAARLPLAFLLSSALFACSKESPVPSAEPKPSAAAVEAEATAVSAVSVAEAPKAEPKVAPSVEAKAAPSVEPKAAPSVEAKAPEKAKAAPSAEAKAPEKAALAPKAEAKAKSGVTLPKPKNGVLAPGEADKIIKAGDLPKVVLLEAGSEPRAELSYTLTKGTKQKLKMGMDMLMSMKMGARSLPPTSIPRMDMLVEMTPVETGKDGFKIESSVTGISLAPKGAQQEQIASAMRPQVDALRGLGMTYWMDAKGHVRDVKTKIPKGLPASSEQMLQGINQSFESLVAPLPSEPVGTGAKWQVVSRVVSAGADIVQSATYTLKDRKDDTISLETQMVQLAASGNITPPGLPDGISADVRNFESGGTGTSAIELKAGLPSSGSSAVRTKMDIAVAGGALLGAPTDTSSVETKLTLSISRP